MNRRTFIRSAVATAVALTLPTLPETWNYSWDKSWWRSSHGRMITDTQLFEINEFWSADYKPSIMIADEVLIKLLKEAWAECK